ncbi:hypothetical protein quinque_004164 [Culex quinquefasciatus]
MKLDSILIVVLALLGVRTVQARIIVTVDTDNHGALAIAANGHNFTLTGQNSDHLITVYTYLDMLLSPKEGSTPEEVVHKTTAPGDDHGDSGSEEDDDFDWQPTHYHKSNHHRYSGGKFRPSRRRRRH